VSVFVGWQISPHYVPSLMEMMTTVTIITIGVLVPLDCQPDECGAKIRGSPCIDGRASPSSRRNHVRSTHAARAVEYLLGLGFLLLFAGFWRYAMAGTSVSAERIAARVRRALPFADMFQVPAGVMLHPGHAWARAESADLVTVGMDDFAQQLVGPSPASRRRRRRHGATGRAPGDAARRFEERGPAVADFRRGRRGERRRDSQPARD
jgi:hypothetical protein